MASTQQRNHEAFDQARATNQPLLYFGLKAGEMMGRAMRAMYGGKLVCGRLSFGKR
ncbi:hypothetical protein FP2506_03339 [Fulvimarina pelagi HTCC2506]|uniref:Uncharacterized protein n=2 Tax=Fulvimarina pelagi TaxID=217511 RepID=Q0G065_9HYPH|nr:hypothetical protein [Fulvimarina pelagi]EAU40728.1 hypothetical protein FP2506_03339 [Fulvimarina pelagi HTCC2506]BAT31270.1 hypothetical protein [Fulvimarina pelagi]